MKGIIVILLILLAGLASAYTPEQQTALEGMNLDYKLGMAYADASQGQNVAEYNTLVDEYNTWIQQHFGEDASLLKSKINTANLQTQFPNEDANLLGINVVNLQPFPSRSLNTNITPVLVTAPITGVGFLAVPFNTSSDLSKFGNPRYYVAIPISTAEQENSIWNAEQREFLL